MATTEEQLAEIVETGGNINEEVLAWINQIGTAATTAITSLDDRYNSILAGGLGIFYLDQSEGDDAHDGSENAPIKTIAKALSMVPEGSSIRVKLISDLYVDEHIDIRNRRLIIEPADANKRHLTFKKDTSVSGSHTYRALYGFRTQMGGGVSLNKMIVNMPAVEGEGALPSKNASIFQGTTVNTDFVADIIFQYCDFNWPANPWGAVTSIWNGSMRVFQCVETGTPLLGYWHSSVDDTAGTNVSEVTAIPLFRTDLAII